MVLGDRIFCYILSLQSLSLMVVKLIINKYRNVFSFLVILLLGSLFFLLIKIVRNLEE